MTSHFYANLYAFSAAVVATVLLMYYPWLKSDHEWQHYMRGLTFSPLYEGGTMPASIITFVKQKKKAAWLELDEDTRRPFSTPRNVTRYPAINYIPHMIAGTLGTTFSLKPVTIYSLTRGLCLLSGIVFGYVILRLLPAFHVPAMIILLLPTGWTMRIQQYPDYVLNIAALMFMTLLVRMLYGAAKVEWWHVAALTATGIVLSMSKLVYFPLVLSIVLLRAGQFRSARHRMACIGIIVGLSGIAAATAATLALQQEFRVDMPTLYAAKFSENATAPTTDPGSSVSVASREEANRRIVLPLDRLLKKPEHFLRRVMHLYTRLAFWEYKTFNMVSYVYYPKHLKKYPGALLPLLVLLPFFVAISNPPRTGPPTTPPFYRLSIYDRLTLLCLIVIIAVLIALSMYLVGDMTFQQVQGRYFISLLPYVALICSVRVPERWQDHLLLLQLCTALAVILILFWSVFR